jgi:hypothetical protein
VGDAEIIHEKIGQIIIPGLFRAEGFKIFLEQNNPDPIIQDESGHNKIEDEERDFGDFGIDVHFFVFTPRGEFCYAFIIIHFPYITTDHFSCYNKISKNNKYKMNRNITIAVAIVVLILLISADVIVGKYYLVVKETKEFPETIGAKGQENIDQSPLASDLKKEDKKPNNPDQANSSIRLVAYNGQIFSAKVPEGWKVDESISGINIISPEDSNVGVFLIAASGWPGKSSPDAFIEKIASLGSLRDIKYLEESEKKKIINPAAPGYVWEEKSKIFTCKKDQSSLKIKSIAGVINGTGQYVAVVQGFQTTLEKWGEWAPLLERVASSVIISNPSKVGGADTVRLPSAKDLANDSSPLMDAWNYRNQVQDKASHDFSDAIMGVESDLVSPSTGRGYTMPLSNYDPTEGGYHNPDNYSEILVDSYK